MKFPRKFYLPKPPYTKVCDKQSDAVAYVYDVTASAQTRFYAAVFFGEQAKPVQHYRHASPTTREKSIAAAFSKRRAFLEHRAKCRTERKTKAIAFRAEIQVGDIFHYSYGYDETHHVFHEVVAVKGCYATVRKIAQAQEDLGYDWRHRCAPQSGEFIGAPVRCLIQDECIRVDDYHHAHKWNVRRVAGVPVGPAYTGGGMH